MSEFLNKNIDLRVSIVEMIAVFGLVFFEDIFLCSHIEIVTAGLMWAPDILAKLAIAIKI